MFLHVRKFILKLRKPKLTIDAEKISEEIFQTAAGISIDLYVNPRTSQPAFE